MKMNHEWTRINTNTDGPASTTSGAKMRLQFCALAVTMSWDEGLLGARASRPHQAWHSLGHLPHLDQPGTAPCLSYGLADGVPADRVAACSIALKLSGGQRDRMRAGRPRSQGNHSPLEGESQKPSRQVKADAVGGGRRVTSQKAHVRPLGNSRLPASRAPAPHDGAHHSEGKQPFVNEDEPPMNTNRHEDRWTSFNDNWRQNASALLSRWCDHIIGGSPPGSAGVPPAQILPQLQPSPPPESTGSGALPLLRPGPCGSRR